MSQHVPVRVAGRLPRPASPDPDRERRLAVLEGYLSENRQQRLELALSRRIESVALVVDGIYDLGNASAIVRSCDGLGLHRLYFVETQHQYKSPARSSQGAHKWLSISRYAEPVSCVRALEEAGYRLLGATLDTDRSLDDIDVSGRVAFAFGAERDGISPEMHEACDQLFRIDMRGLVQSFNVSVAAAITLHEALRRRDAEAVSRGETPGLGDMPAEEMDLWREIFYRVGVQHADKILERHLGEAPPPLPRLKGVLRALDK